MFACIVFNTYAGLYILLNRASCIEEELVMSIPSLSFKRQVNILSITEALVKQKVVIED